MIQRDIQESAYRAQLAVDAGTATVVGVNRFVADAPRRADGDADDRSGDRAAADRARARASARAAARRSGSAALDAVTQAARDGSNLVPPIVAAVEAHATVGEIADAMREVFGEYKEIASL